jgi:hypothetical protein
MEMEGCAALDLELDMGEEMDWDVPLSTSEVDMDVDTLPDAPPSTSIAEDSPSATNKSSFTPTSASDSSLTPHVSGDPASQQTHNATPPAQLPRFDPRALLNPTAAIPTSTAKRPASSGEDGSRGRAEIVAPPGQVSLVERLHNVQERTASPAKRVKTDEQVKARSSGFGSGALDLGQGNGQYSQHSNGYHPTPQSTAVDLTMSKCNDVSWI